MNALLIFEVSRRSHDLHERLLIAGFIDTWNIGVSVVNLPTSAVWMPLMHSHSEAMRIFDGVISELNYDQPPQNVIAVRRLVVVDFSLMVGIPGKPRFDT